MQITHELLDNFFQNKCNSTEVEAILLYFKTNSDELDKYLTKNEWDNLSANQAIDPEISQKLYHALKEELFPEKAFIAIDSNKKYWLAAASVILISMVSFFLLAPRLNTKTLVATGNTIKPKKTVGFKVQKENPKWKTVINNGNNVEEVNLPDGSLVSLYPKSFIRYPEVFENNKREIILTGDAFFQVAKNRQKPFTVYAGCLSTTALGTSFRITLQQKKKDDIQIKLYTGKVCIKATETLKNWGDHIYLNPGEQVYFNKSSDNFPVVSNFGRMEQNSPVNKIIPLKIQIQQQEAKFDKASLEEVIESLSVFFNVHIEYTREDIANMNFTGTITHADDVASVLKVIALMNGLEAEKSDKGYRIIKTR